MRPADPKPLCLIHDVIVLTDASGAPAAGTVKKLSKVEELMKRDLEAKARREASQAAVACSSGQSQTAPAAAGSSAKGRSDHWLMPGIIVKVLSKALKEHGYYKQKVGRQTMVWYQQSMTLMSGRCVDGIVWQNIYECSVANGYDHPLSVAVHVCMHDGLRCAGIRIKQVQCKPYRLLSLAICEASTPFEVTNQSKQAQCNSNPDYPVLSSRPLPPGCCGTCR